MYVFVCFICNVNHAVDHFCDNITLFMTVILLMRGCAGLEGGRRPPPPSENLNLLNSHSKNTDPLLSPRKITWIRACK